MRDFLSRRLVARLSLRNAVLDRRLHELAVENRGIVQRLNIVARVGP